MTGGGPEARRGGREALSLGLLALISVSSVVILLKVSDRLNLRGQSTPEQAQLGTLVWTAAASTLLGAVMLACYRLPSGPPRWLTVIAWGALVLAMGEVVSEFVFFRALPRAIGDTGALSVVMIAGVTGTYTSSRSIIDAVRSRRSARSLTSAACAGVAAFIVVLAVWSCLFLQ